MSLGSLSPRCCEDTATRVKPRLCTPCRWMHPRRLVSLVSWERFCLQSLSHPKLFSLARWFCKRCRVRLRCMRFLDLAPSLAQWSALRQTIKDCFCWRICRVCSSKWASTSPGMVWAKKTCHDWPINNVSNYSFRGSTSNCLRLVIVCIHVLYFLPIRFAKKLPTGASEVSVPDILCGLFRMKGDRAHGDPQCIYNRFLKRLVHTFCQHCEDHLPRRLQASCPDPVVGAKFHPFMKASRVRGNRSIAMNLSQRFMAKGGGYVSLKETRLDDMGIVSKKSSLATKTTSELCCRALLKSEQFMQGSISESKVLNFCFDAAFVSQQHVAQLNNKESKRFKTQMIN